MRFAIGLDAGDAEPRETVRRVAKQADRLQHGFGDERLEDVEFEVSLTAGECNDGFVADHLRAHHAERFGLGRVNLARHDRRARLVLRQMQFTQSRAGAGPEQTDIARDLE